MVPISLRTLLTSAIFMLVGVAIATIGINLAVAREQFFIAALAGTSGATFVAVGVMLLFAALRGD